MDIPRSKYSTAFADYLSNDEDNQKEYTNGLLILICILGGAFLTWGSILMFLKFKGSDVGCASGRAFESQDDQMGITDSTDLEEFSNSIKSSGNHDDPALEETSFPSSSLCSSDVGSLYESSNSIFNSADTDDISYKEGPRAFRTRIMFFIFACLVLACVPIGLALSFAPMKEVLKSPEELFRVSKMQTNRETRATQKKFYNVAHPNLCSFLFYKRVGRKRYHCSSGDSF